MWREWREMHVLQPFPRNTRLRVPENPAPKLLRLHVPGFPDEALVAWDDDRFCDLGPWDDLVRQVHEHMDKETI